MTDTDVSALNHCTGRQLKDLLALAHSEARATRDELLEAGDTEQLEHLLDEMCAGSGQSGAALLPAVLSLETSLEGLTAIKSTAKRLTVAAKDPRQNAAATLLYHLSIASALGRYGKNISSQDPAARLELYQDLAAELSDDELAAIFEKAVAALRPSKS
jgi:hypothetical protein